jgi:hypothetical protein
MVNSTCGIVVSTANTGESQTVAGIAHAMIYLATMSPEEFNRLSEGAIARSNELTWASLTARVVNCKEWNAS